MKDDNELLKDYARKGNVQALSELVVRHSPWMSAFLRGMLPDVEVEDALQDCWFKVMRSAQNFRGNGLKTYLGTVARSVAVDRLRKQNKLVCMDASNDDEGLQPENAVDTAPLPDERFESDATREDVYRAVRLLPQGQRQVLLLRIEAEMSFREIASELNIPLGTALTWMHVATHRLKKSLGENA